MKTNSLIFIIAVLCVCSVAESMRKLSTHKKTIDLDYTKDIDFEEPDCNPIVENNPEASPKEQSETTKKLNEAVYKCQNDFCKDRKNNQFCESLDETPRICTVKYGHLSDNKGILKQIDCEKEFCYKKEEKGKSSWFCDDRKSRPMKCERLDYLDLKEIKEELSKKKEGKEEEKPEKEEKEEKEKAEDSLTTTPEGESDPDKKQREEENEKADIIFHCKQKFCHKVKEENRYSYFCEDREKTPVKCDHEYSKDNDYEKQNKCYGSFCKERREQEKPAGWFCEYWHFQALSNKSDCSGRDWEKGCPFYTCPECDEALNNSAEDNSVSYYKCMKKCCEAIPGAVKDNYYCKTAKEGWETLPKQEDKEKQTEEKEGVGAEATE